MDKTFCPCDECQYGTEKRDVSGDDSMCQICEFKKLLKSAAPENQTCCGYPVQELITTSHLLKAHLVEPNDIKKLCDNFQLSFNLVNENFQKQLSESVRKPVQK